jgi:hypothetical protein
MRLTLGSEALLLANGGGPAMRGLGWLHSVSKLGYQYYSPCGGDMSAAYR